MDKSRRAERLITFLRWFVIMLGLAAVNEHMPKMQLAVLMGVVAIYNGTLMVMIADPARFMRFGKTASFAARVLDIAVISIFLASSEPGNTPSYLLYWFPLVACGYTTSSIRRLVVALAITLTASTGAIFLSKSAPGTVDSLMSTLAIRSGAIVFGFLVAAYIAKSRSQDELASERGSYLHALLNCGARLTSFRTVHDLALYVLETAVTETDAGGGELLLLNDDSQELECEAFYMADNPAQGGVSPTEGMLKSYANWVMGSGREILIRAGGKSEEDTSVDHDSHPAVAVPLLWQSSASESNNSVLGVLIVWGRAGDDFGSDAVDILRIFAALASAAIVSLRLYTTLQRSFLRTLQSLANGLEARDEYTRGHSERVMQVACAIAQELGVPNESLESLRNAALLHDIGKIGVPDAILRKAGKLTAEEWETMRKHPVVSEEICRPLGLQTEVLFLIKHHQERLDGMGYPAGLSAQEQPLLLRIIVVSDSFDAMRSRRPYRDRMPQEELVGELNRSAGRSLDPTVVEALKRLMDRGDLDIIYEDHDRMIDGTIRSMKSIKKAA